MPTYRIRLADGRVVRVPGDNADAASQGAAAWARVNPPAGRLLGQFKAGVADTTGQTADNVFRLLDPVARLETASHLADPIASVLRMAGAPDDPNANARQIVARPDGSFIDATGKTYRADPSKPGLYLDQAGQSYAPSGPPRRLGSDAGFAGNILRDTAGPGAAAALLSRVTAPQPTNEGERIARAIGAFLPNAFGGDAGLATRAARVLAPAFGSEASRSATQTMGGEKRVQDIASMAGGLLGGGLGGLKLRAPAASMGAVEGPPVGPWSGEQIVAANDNTGGGTTTLPAASPDNLIIGNMLTRRAANQNGIYPGERFGDDVEPFWPEWADPPMSRQDAVKSLLDENIRLTPRQIARGAPPPATPTGGAGETADPAMTKLDFRAQSDMNRALGNRVLAAFGKTVPARIRPGPPLLKFVKNNLLASEQDLRAPYAMQFDPTFLNQALEIVRPYQEQYSKYANNAYNLASIPHNILFDNPGTPGNLSAIMDFLDGQLQNARLSNKEAIRALATPAQRVKDAVTRAATAQYPDYLDVQGTLDEAHANMALLREAASREETLSGGFNGAHLMDAYQDLLSDPTTRAAARGGRDMFDFVNNVNSIMGSDGPTPTGLAGPTPAAPGPAATSGPPTSWVGAIPLNPNLRTSPARPAPPPGSPPATIVQLKPPGPPNQGLPDDTDPTDP